MKKKNIVVIAALLAAAAFIGFMTTTCQVDTAERVTVSFVDPGGGNTFNDVRVIRGTSLGGNMPSPALYQGEAGSAYTFYGWFEDATRYDRDTPISADMTLTARWSDEVAKVEFAFTQPGAGGEAILPTVLPAPIETIKGIPLGLLGFPSGLRAQGWEIAGWTLNGEAFDETTPVPGDITLTAVWAAKQAYTVIFESAGGTAVPDMIVYANDGIDEWEVRLPTSVGTNAQRPEAEFFAWIDSEKRIYDGRTIITKAMVDSDESSPANTLRLLAKWMVEPFAVDLRLKSAGGHIAELQDVSTEGENGVSEVRAGGPYEVVSRLAWDSDQATKQVRVFAKDANDVIIKNPDNSPQVASWREIENPYKDKWVIVNSKMYDTEEVTFTDGDGVEVTAPHNANRWKILYRIKLELPDSFNINFFTRYTVRARFYGNEQAEKTSEIQGFKPNILIDGPAGYSETGLLWGTNEDSPSDDGWGQVSFCGEESWNGGASDALTMLQRYNLDRKGGTINDTWEPSGYKDLLYPPYLLVQTSDNFVGHIEITDIIFHNGELEHTLYIGEELVERPTEETEE